MMREILSRLNAYREAFMATGDGNSNFAILLKDAADELQQCRDELCLLCGRYKQKHLGACDGCRWR